MSARAADVKLVFVDVETTGLDPTRHDIWELAVTIREAGTTAPDHKRDWLMRPDLAEADPRALSVGGYYDRGANAKFACGSHHARGAARLLATETADGVLVGSTPTFDQQFLDNWLRRHGEAPAWDYHLVDVVNLAMGMRPDLIAPGARLSDAADALHISYSEEQRHTARGDCDLARAVFDEVYTLRGDAA